MIQLNCLVLTLVLVQSSSVNGKHFVVRGTVNAMYHRNVENITNSTECVRRKCGENRNCAATYRSKRCFSVILSAQIIYWMRHKLTQKDDFHTIFNGPESFFIAEAPQVLWLFDEVSRGINLGTQGSNIFTPMHCNYLHRRVTFNQTGPNPGWTLRYLYQTDIPPGGENNRPIENAFDFTDDYTFVLWIKTEQRDHPMTLFLANPGGTWLDMVRKDNLTIFKFQAYPEGTKSTRTIESKPLNATTALQWRHIAFTFHRHCCGKMSVKFYINGDLFHFQDRPEACAKITSSYYLLFLYKYYDAQFIGSMACVMLFNRILAQREIQHVMHNCP